MKYIYHHLGLGDHIICNGLVRTLIDPNYEYSMFVKPHNKISVEFMYRDLPNLKFIEGDDFFASNFLKSNKINKEDIITAGFYRHPGSIEFDDSFYLQHNIPFSNRWDNFYVKRDYEREYELFEKYDLIKNEYVFLHDDKSRGFSIDENNIKNKSLKIVRPLKGITENIFDYCFLMQNSLESHFIDSSFRLIFDSLKLRNSEIYYHINLLNGVLKDSTKSQSILDFTII
jgi:hypothetical protein